MVEVGLALPPAALHALSLSSTYVSLKTAPDGGRSQPHASHYAPKRIRRSNRNPDAREDVNAEFSGLPYVCVGEVLCVFKRTGTARGSTPRSDPGPVDRRGTSGG